MFGSEVWEYYILQVKGIIQRVKQEVGFTVNGELNSKNLSYLKSTLKEIFRENEEIKLLDFFLIIRYIQLYVEMKILQNHF